MLRKLLFGTLAAIVLGAAIQSLTAAPAQAQASCMHCTFALAKCKRVGTLTPAKCEEQRATCVTECKAMDAAASGGADKTKSAEKSEKKSKK